MRPNKLERLPPRRKPLMHRPNLINSRNPHPASLRFTTPKASGARPPPHCHRQPVHPSALGAVVLVDGVQKFQKPPAWAVPRPCRGVDPVSTCCHGCLPSPPPGNLFTRPIARTPQPASVSGLGRCWTARKGWTERAAETRGSHHEEGRAGGSGAGGQFGA
jgi:hypothetical protein